MKLFLMAATLAVMMFSFMGRDGCVDGTLTADDKCSFWVYQYTENGPAWVHWNTNNERWERPVPDSDTDTFQVLEGGFAKDKNKVYLQAIVIQGADPASFEILAKDSQLSRDFRAAYKGIMEIAGAQAKHIKALNSTYSTDGKNIYSGSGLLPNADVSSFKTTGQISGRDKYRCYLAIEVVPCQ